MYVTVDQRELHLLLLSSLFRHYFFGLRPLHSRLWTSPRGRSRWSPIQKLHRRHSFLLMVLLVWRGSLGPPLIEMADGWGRDASGSSQQHGLGLCYTRFWITKTICRNWT